MKRISVIRLLIVTAVLFASLQVSAQSRLERKVLMTIGGQPVTVKEFTDVYNKNNLREEVVEKKTIDEYLELYINYRMKVMEAYAMQLDTSAKFKRELSGYRTQLARPYFTNEEVSEELVQEAYQRKQYDIRASHILITCDKHALPADTLRAYNRAMDIRQRALRNPDFESLAVTYSQDPSARDVSATETTPARKGNHGDLGYFTVFDMVYPFETGAYNTPEGEISMPVRTDYGYHIIKVNSVTEALGTINAAHIFLQLDANASEEEEQAMRDRAENIYNEIMAENGRKWNEAVSRYTDDRGTVNRGGALTPFTVSRIVPEFIEAIKQLQPGEISRPVRTHYGFHIIKLLNNSGVGTFERERQGLAERVERDMRSKKSEEVVLQQIKSDYGFSNKDRHISDFIASVDSTILRAAYVPAENVRPNQTLFSIGRATYTVSDFIDYINAHQTAQRYVTPQTYAYQLFEAFQNEKVLAYADEHLEERYPEFKALVQEYNDGILLFDLMDSEVWSKAVNDTAGLREFHSRHINGYMWDNRVKACVITVNRPESLPKVRSYLDEGVPFDSLRTVLNRDSVAFVQVRNNFYQRGDNPFVDQTEWVAGTRNEIPSTVDQSTVIVNIIELRDPEPKTLPEARGLITSDYQAELEEQWLEYLHRKYPVSVNERVLEQVRALYQ